MAAGRPQFTIGNLLKVTLLTGILIFLLDVRRQPITACLAFLVAVIIIADLKRNETNLVYRLPLTAGVIICVCVYAYFSFGSIEPRPWLLGLFAALVPTPLIRAVFQAPYRFFRFLGRSLCRSPLSDEACGRIARREFDEDANQRT